MERGGMDRLRSHRGTRLSMNFAPADWLSGAQTSFTVKTVNDIFIWMLMNDGSFLVFSHK